jgi:hypothetical protein
MQDREDRLRQDKEDGLRQDREDKHDGHDGHDGHDSHNSHGRWPSNSNWPRQDSTVRTLKSD